MSSPSHIIIFGILFFLFFRLTNVSQRLINLKYWSLLLFPIVAYSIIVGTRWGWGTDYEWYKYRFEHPLDYIDEDIGWQKLNIFLNIIGLDYVGAYIVYSFVFICGGSVLIKSYKENKYMLFLFVLVTMGFSTQAIRQAFAHSFVFLGIYFLNSSSKRRWLFIAAIMLIIFSIHPAALLTLIIAIGFSHVKKTIPLKVAICIFLGVSLLSNILTQYVATNFPEFVKLIPMMGTKFEGYADNGEKWFGDESIEEERIQSPSAFLLSTLYYCCFIYLTHLSLKYKYNKNVAYIFNVNFLGICAYKAFILFEILLRIAQPLECLIFVPLGYDIYFWKYYRYMLSEKEKRYSDWAMRGIIFYLLLYYGRFLFINSNTAFVWDK